MAKIMLCGRGWLKEIFFIEKTKCCPFSLCWQENKKLIKYIFCELAQRKNQSIDSSGLDRNNWLKNFSSTMNPQQNEVEKKGWLFKWTNYLKGYQKRYFILSNGVLSYYRWVLLFRWQISYCFLVNSYKISIYLFCVLYLLSYFYFLRKKKFYFLHWFGSDL